MLSRNIFKTAVGATIKMRIKQTLRRKAARFVRDESGVLVVFSVFFLLMILMVGGVGIDLMRFEMTRTSLQHTLDRAILAAADLDQELSPTEVVNDYFSKSSMAEYLASVTVDQGLNYKTVSATAEIEMKTQFMHMLGVSVLDAPAAGTAEERIDGVEISLVLDISGSMASNSRLTNLKSAAKDFVDTVMDSSAPGDVSLSLVPYTTNVALGDRLMSEFNTTIDHDYSTCIDFVGADFTSTGLSTTTLRQQSGHFDKWSSSETYIDNGDEHDYPVCPTGDDQEIQAFSINRTALKSQIDGLEPLANTAIDVGMKWGAALLDPQAQSIVTSMIASGDIDGRLAGRPVSYNTANTLKVVVLMTDGQNTSQYMLKDQYSSGQSNIWRHANGRYSVKSGNYYYYPHNQSWNYNPYSYYGSASVRLDYPEVFARMPLRRYRDYLYRFSNNRNNIAYYNLYSTVSGSTKNTRLNQVCNAAKDAGIIVYTIGFEAPSSGQLVLESCASSDAHYFDVDGVEITDAFAAIASSISKLRLTQ